MKNIQQEIESRIERVPFSGCWIWMRCETGVGYGFFGRLGERRAHRVSYRAFVGPIVDGLFVLHRCDIPLCVNPAHLFLGTQRDNLSDMHAKGRADTTTGIRAASRARRHPDDDPCRCAELGKKCRRCIRIYTRNYWAARRLQRT